MAPPNIGPKTFPNYQTFVDGAIRKLGDGTKVFVGQRDDPFFVDLGATFDGLNVRKLTGNQGQGKDDLSGMNTHSVVMQIPEARVTKNGKSVSGPAAGNAVVGVWSTTERRRLDVTDALRAAAAQEGRTAGSNRWVQVSRLGNPLVNEVVIPLGQKDRFNRTTPDRDAALYGKYVVKPELAAVLNALFDVGRPGERPHGHRAGAAPGHPRPEPAQGDQGPAGGRHDQAQPRRAARERRGGPVRRDRRRHWPGSRTAAGSRTTWWTSSSRWWPGS